MKTFLRCILASPLLVAFACTAVRDSTFDDDSGSSESGGSTEATGATSGGGGVDFTTANSAGTGSGSNNCNTDPNVDDDGDGFSEAQGDCNDCDANSGPNAVEVPTEMGQPQADEDCDGQVDEPPDVCDQGLAIGDTDAMNGAKAIGLCKTSMNGGWGVVSAAYTRANGSAVGAGLNVGLPANFGNTAQPQEGGAMLVLSSGHARDANDPAGCGSMTCDTSGMGQAPAGFPQNVPGCQGQQDINDDIALELKIKAPANAKGYSFDFAFMSFEFAEYVCTSYNDQFIALVSPPPMGSLNGNISFDSKTNPVSVNIALFDHCDPSTLSTFAQFCAFEIGSTCPQAPMPYCPNGAGFMNGTGFNEWGDSGSTGWLVTTAPVQPNEEFTIRFAIWDTGDSALDSTVLIDNFKFTADAGKIGTNPIPNPR
jgi:hypothetical protein